MDGLTDQRLSVFGAHILIIGAEHNARLGSNRLGDALYVHRRGDVASAPAHKYANSLHGIVSYFLYLRMALTSACWGILSSSSAGRSSGLMWSMPC